MLRLSASSALTFENNQHLAAGTSLFIPEIPKRDLCLTSLTQAYFQDTITMLFLGTCEPFSDGGKSAELTS